MIKDENLHSSIDYSELQKEAAKKHFIYRRKIFLKSIFSQNYYNYLIIN